MLLLPVLLVAATSCRPNPVTPDNPKEQKSITCLSECTLPEDVTDLTIQKELFTLHNITTGRGVEYKMLEKVKLAPGLYDPNYTTNCRYKLKGVLMERRLVTQIENLKVTNQTIDPLKLRLRPRIMPMVRDFVIQKIFFTGTQITAGRPYVGTSYAILYNGTDKVLYADGIALYESEFNPTIKQNYKPDLRWTSFVPHAVYIVPGSGKEHPVRPGGRLIPCNIGIDHKAINPNASDPSKANLGWYGEFSVPTHQGFNSPMVPNPDKWYCYTRTFFILNNRGPASHVIARTLVTKKTWFEDYVYDYSYVFVGTGNETKRSFYCIPLDWTIDGVNCSVEAMYKWTILPRRIDAGYTHCSKVDRDSGHFFHNVCRKCLGKDVEGRMILQDTNDSAEDFNPMVTVPFIKEQGSAIDAKGMPYTTKTHDGVVPIDK